METLSLADALEAKAAEPVRSRCWFQSLSADDQAALTRYFATPMTNSTISDALRSQKFEISDFRVGYHRRGKCKCQR